MKFKIILLIIFCLILAGCYNISYKLSGYYRVSFEWNSKIKNVYLNNKKINQKEKYYINKANHEIKWEKNKKEFKKIIFIDKSGRYYLNDDRVYYLKTDLEIVN